MIIEDARGNSILSSVPSDPEKAGSDLASKASVINVRLIDYTPDPERVVAAAAKLCYSPSGALDIMAKISDDEIPKFLKKIIKLGHLSVIEHASFTFAVEGISRACSHQLVRHRLASYSQQSQRYVKYKEDLNYVTPARIKAKPEIEERYHRLIKEIKALYDEMLRSNIPAEDARYVLPNATETKVVVTMNARELLHFFDLRLSKHAQWEIRQLANLMLQEVKKVAPNLFAPV